MTKFRTESDLIGDLQVPAEAYYGVQTQRAIENFRITGTKMGDYPEFVKAIGYVKLAAAQTNHELGLLPDTLLKPISQACEEVISGKFDHQFLVDMIQGGAGTSVNMNANEVIANRALEIMGYGRGEYQHCSPNDHVNQSQSTNDAYPTTVKLAVIKMNEKLIERLSLLIEAFRQKGKEFSDVIKMGRTQLQDAVPMTLGQEFEAFAANLEEEIARLQSNAKLFLEINMGGTAIGTGLNAPKGYAQLCASDLLRLLGLLRHGHRHRPAAGHPLQHQLRLPLPVGHHHRVLASVAHFALHLAQGLPIYQSRRQSARPRPYVRQPHAYDAPRRALARSFGPLHPLGRTSRGSAGRS